MKAIVVQRFGDPEQLTLDQTQPPQCGDDQLRIAVRTCGVNPIDYRIRRGEMWWLPGGPPYVPGFDVAGDVVEVGGAAARAGWRIGESALAFLDTDLHGGGYAEFAVVGAESAARKPDQVSYEEAAATPLAALTALQSLRDAGKLKRSGRVLINGASGGVGVFAVQIARLMDAYVVGVCSGRNVEFVRELGAHDVVDYQQQDFTARDDQFDVVFDVVAKSSFSACRRILTPRGHYVTTVPQKSSLLRQAVNLCFRRKCKNILAKPDGPDLRTITDWMRQGKLRVEIEQVFPLDRAADAHRLIEQGHVRGKLVLRIEDKNELEEEEEQKPPDVA